MRWLAGATLQKSRGKPRPPPELQKGDRNTRHSKQKLTEAHDIAVAGRPVGLAEDRGATEASEEPSGAAVKNLSAGFPEERKYGEKKDDKSLPKVSKTSPLTFAMLGGY